MQPEPKRLPIFLPLAVPAFTFVLGLIAFWFGWASSVNCVIIVLLGVCCGLLIALWQRPSITEGFSDSVNQIFELAQDRELSAVQNQFVGCLNSISQFKDPIYRELAMIRLHGIVRQTETLAGLTIEYSSTESWRVAYEKLLRSPGLHLYRSVSHIESVHYWQDGPGEQSTRLNLELHDSRTISVERIAIIADHLWPSDSRFPEELVRAWLHEQHLHGIWVRLIRESQLIQEENLQLDFGIYGNRAVVIQISDVSGRTVRFELNFDFERVQRAEEMWNRLTVYAVSFQDLLDQDA